jgi:transposase-like protein
MKRTAAEKRAAVKDLEASGESQAAVAKRHGCSPVTLRAWLRESEAKRQSKAPATQPAPRATVEMAQISRDDLRRLLAEKARAESRVTDLEAELARRPAGRREKALERHNAQLRELVRAFSNLACGSGPVRDDD